MTTKHLSWFAALTLSAGTSLAGPLGTAFTYQGKLADGGQPASGSYDLKFTLFAAASGGTPVAGPTTNSPVGVSNGLFTITLDFGPGVFTGEARWLEIAVRTNGGGAFTPLSPRQPLTPAPYALFAPSAGAATTAGSAAAVTANGVANASLQADAVTTDKIADGTIAAADLSPALASNTFWRVGGNVGTTPSTQFVGTTDNQPLELRANNQRILRLEPDPVNNAPNVIAGSSSNTVAPGVVGAVIAGGGRGTQPNRVFGAWGVIAGGELNVVSNNYDVVSGGLANTASGGMSTVGGGSGNVAQDLPLGRATVAGGMDNRATGSAAVVGGGRDNSATNQYATVPGGRNNLAGGSDSLAAGRRAKALHPGGFVWADATDADFVSTANNQFLIRASGGVGIGTNNPQTALHVAGTVTAGGFSGSGAGVTGLNASQLASGAVPDARLSANVSLLGGSIESGEITDGTITAADVQANTFWKNTGNAGTMPGTHFLGTMDNQPLELRVNGQRALRIEPDAVSPRLIGGYGSNQATAVGSVVVGGGASGAPNQAHGLYSTIAGGAGNTIASVQSGFIGGGAWNTIQTFAGLSAIGGGSDNVIRTNAFYGVIGGGFSNIIGDFASAANIGGGDENTIQPYAASATIAGGEANTIQTSAEHATIAGGQLNTVQTNASNATIGGGWLNTIQSDAFIATIGGGYGNTIQTTAYHATIGGGFENTIQAGANDATLGGGYGNTASSPYATVGGGSANSATGPGAFVGGGGHDAMNAMGNTASGAVSVVGGGGWNTAAGPFASVGGGGGNAANNGGATVAGGWYNTASGAYATVPGGDNNTAAGGYAFAAGNRAKANHTGAFVWADSTEADFTSTTNNQFNLRATGGVRVDTGVGPGISLSAADSPLITRGWDAFGATAPASKQGHGRWGLFMESFRLAIGIPDDVGGRYFEVAKYSTNGSSTALLTLDQGGNLRTTTGVISTISDRNLKTDFAPVDGREILERLMRVPVQTWRFKEHPPEQRHLGAMAQDFHAAFGVGLDERSICTVDADGVALAAIQGLNQKLEEKNAALEKQVAELTTLVRTLAEKVNGGGQ